MINRQPIVIGETEYPSISAAARDMNCSRERLKYRLKFVKDEKLVTSNGSIFANSKGIEYKGIHYPTIKQFAKRFGIYYGAVKMQLFRGKTAQEIIEKHNKKIVRNEVRNRGR